MRAVDTNVLLRLVVGDEPDQTRLAEGFVSGGAWVPLVALAETIWALGSIYDQSLSAQARAVEMLLDEQSIVIENREAVIAALRLFRSKPSLGFSDCLILESARKAGHVPLGTFDRRLAKVEGAQRL